jgi:hypothetical protein
LLLAGDSRFEFKFLLLAGDSRFEFKFSLLILVGIFDFDSPVFALGLLVGSCGARGRREDSEAGSDKEAEKRSMLSKGASRREGMSEKWCSLWGAVRESERESSRG